MDKSWRMKCKLSNWPNVSGVEGRRNGEVDVLSSRQKK